MIDRNDPSVAGLTFSDIEARIRRARPGADSLHTIKAAMMSEGCRRGRRWPEPIPIPETAAIAQGAVQDVTAPVDEQRSKAS